MKRYAWLAYLLVALVVLSFIWLRWSAYSVKIEKNLEYEETIYSIAQGETKFEMVTYQTELNSAVMSYTSNAASINSQISPLIAILKQVKKHKGAIPPVLFWHGNSSYPEFFKRVSSATAKSLLWDITTGRPFEGDKALAIIKIANEVRAYPELEKVFSRFGLAIKVSSVEKVLVDPKTKLPYDFLLWFRLEKK